MLELSRRQTFRLGAGAAVLAGAPALLRATPPGDPPPPISETERKGRVARAQSRMQALGIGALLIEPGASLDYLTGVQWSRSERLTAAVIPASGEPVIVTPFFERPSVASTLR